MYAADERNDEGNTQGRADATCGRIALLDMRQLDLNYIDTHAPYSVTMRTEQVYYFKTDVGMLCTITFMDDYSIWETGAYQFVINNENHVSSPLDPKLRDTIFSLIDAFFAANPDILLYICETGDGKQEFRSRLFVRWFNTYSGRDAYVMKTAEVKEGKTKNFAALIIQKDNPRAKKIIAEFDETISILTNKPNEQ